jgi:hypothetical protein
MNVNRWLDELERTGVVKRKEDAVNAMIVLGCIAAAAGVVLLAVALHR